MKTQAPGSVVELPRSSANTGGCAVVVVPGGQEVSSFVRLATADISDCWYLVSCAVGNFITK